VSEAVEELAFSKSHRDDRISNQGF
jgi:hypothetical protein